MHFFLKTSLFLITCILSAFFITYFFTPSASAQSVSCVITKIGNHTSPTPRLPAGCPTIKFTPTGVIPAPNVTKCITVSGGEYCQMPPALSNEYIKILHHNGAPWQDWGSRELINIIYTVAQNWKYKYPQGFVIIGDMASYYHDITPTNRGNHPVGVAADITATTNGHDCVANNNFDNRCTYGPPYNSAATIELGKLFMNTGRVYQILYSDPFTNAMSQLRNYGRTTNTAVYDLSDHRNHFHIDTRATRLPYCDRINPRAC